MHATEKISATEETLKEMKSKHPEAPLPVLPPGPLPDAVRFDKELVRKKVDGLCCTQF